MKTVNPATGEYFELTDDAELRKVLGDGSLALLMTSVGQAALILGEDGEPEYQRAFELLESSCSRDSKGWYPEWDFTNGGVCGRLTEYANNAIRYGSQGLLEEASSTNQIRNPRCEGAVAGTPGTLPTNWEIFANGTTSSVVSSGYENGWPYVDIRFNGTPTSNPYVNFDSATAASASNGQTWSASVGAKLQAGDATNVDGVICLVRIGASGGGFLSSFQNTSQSVDSTHKRFFVTGTISNASTAHVQQRLTLDWDGSGAVDITLRIYAPQLEQASAPSSPILPVIGTPAATTRTTETVTGLTTVSRSSRKSNAGEWDFTNGGSVGAFREYLPDVPAVTGKGLLVEEETTNQIRNPRGEGISNGNEPTYWINATAWDAITTFSSGTENGWPYIDVAFNGTPTGDNVLSFDGQTQIAALTGQGWSLSCGIKVVSGDFTNIGAFKLRMREATSGGSFVAARDTSDLQGSIDSTHRRFVNSATLSGGGTTAFVGPQILISWSSGAVNLTLRIYAPQLERKAYPTSPILPPKGAPGAATRAADDIEVGNGAWSNDNGPGTLYVDAVLNNGGAASNFGTIGASYGEDVSVDYIRFRAAGTTNFNVVAEDDNSVVVSTVSTTSLTGAGQSVRAAIAWNTDDIAASVNGGAQGTDNSASIGFGAAKIIIASGANSTTFPSQYVKQIRYFPRRLSNAELETLVGNS